jgi:hypothetical protein
MTIMVMAIMVESMMIMFIIPLRSTKGLMS